LVGAKLNYTVIENELLPVVLTLIKFKHYVTGYKVFVHIYHVVIIYLMNKLYINGRIIRWVFLLQRFDLTILDRPDKQNVAADFLSMLTIHTEEDMIDDQFPYENLFSISTQTPYFTDIENFPTTGKLPQHCSYRERCKIVQKILAPTWVDGYLFKVFPNQFLRICIR
jgi:hypothetical protein